MTCVARLQAADASAAVAKKRRHGAPVVARKRRNRVLAKAIESEHEIDEDDESSTESEETDDSSEESEADKSSEEEFSDEVICVTGALPNLLVSMQ